MSEHTNLGEQMEGLLGEKSTQSETEIRDTVNLDQEGNQIPTWSTPMQDHKRNTAPDQTSSPLPDSDPSVVSQTDFTAQDPGADGERKPFMSNSAPVFQAPQEELPKEIRPTGPSMPTIVLGLVICFFAIIFLALGLLYLYYGRTMTEGIRWTSIFPIFLASLGFFFLLIAIFYGLTARGRKKHVQESDRSASRSDWKGQSDSDQAKGIKPSDPSEEETSSVS